jgi:hypothetical protein
MAVIANSNQYDQQTTINRAGLPTETKTIFFEGITPTADVGTINFVRLPPGKLRILTHLSAFLCANMAATANIAIGTAAYTASNGVAVAAATAVLKAVGLVNACVLANAPTLLANVANMALLVDSLDGVGITGTVSTANTVVNATFSGYITYNYLG